ncbi:MAG: TonB-dependent receptor [Phaeodactylibacter sp.]|nr:TonB-dependent receptor [Phaeodactylibacter sp.]
MARYLLLTLTLLLFGVSASVAQTSLRGKVTDKESGEPVIFANVVLKKNGVFITGGETDFDGNYSITSLDPGVYDVEVSQIEYSPQTVTGVQVSAGKANSLDVQMFIGQTLDEIIVIGYEIPLIEQDNTTQGGTVSAETIQRLPTKSITAIAGTVGGVASADEGDDTTIKGSRPDATNYYIDGIRVSGNLIPQSEIDQLQVITGGIEAQYGDVTGGVISITTKGPSSKFTGGFELETSEYLDNYGYNLAMVNLSGPLIKKGEKSILGFRVSGQYRLRRDDDPPAIPVYQITDEVRTQLEAEPIVLSNSGYVPAAAFVDFSGVNELKSRPNEENTRYDLTAKLDLRVTDNIDLSVTGTYNEVIDYFTPSGSSSDPNAVSWRVFNSHNNPFDDDLRYRGNIRLRHRLGGGVASSGEEGDETERKSSFIQNASYTLQFGYERRQYSLSDLNHQDRFFDYGYVGHFDQIETNTFGPPIDPATYPFPVQHRDFNLQFSGYTPGDVNPVLAAYNNAVPEISTNADIIAQNGFVSQVYSEVWNLHANIGTVYNLYRQRDEETITFLANSSFELVPSGDSDEGRHNIQFGIWYEQRTNRGYDLNPRALWQIGRQQVNRHILGVDTTNIIGDTTLFGFNIPVYGKAYADLEDNLFYKEVRQEIGTPIDEFVNIDGLTPDQLRLDMFSSRELTSQNILDYWGYDHLGNPIEVTFDDFFTATSTYDFNLNGVTDTDTIRTFPVAAYRPIYAAAYIQDKFTFKDIIFRVGVRVDRFDANTKVLKDPYSLYDIVGAGDFHTQVGSEKPSTIGDDFKVYTESEGSNNVKAYRNGDQWYTPNGTQVNNPNLIFGGEVVNPRFTTDDPNIQSRDYDPSISFKDYEQQTNFMPRLAFSFPINKEANFFAHYDVLVQRPPSNNYASPLDYFYWQERTGIRSNPALRPERTVDYEVGFQQKLTNSSAIKVAAYYKEMRDMIQSRTFIYAVPRNQYTTYDNIDFGTVKGFTFQYDLRRTGNVSLLLAYTLQFADGTGSDANSNRNLSNQGIQRTLFPLNFDERHRIVTTLDYRYKSGKEYNGPELFGTQFLANTGLNVQAIAVSGRPYTAKSVPNVLGGSSTVGSINGARLPWNFTINARLDKDFNLVKDKDKRQLGLNVYVRVSNLLNQRNIINVYSATGSPENDGYLASSRGLDAQSSVETSGFPLSAYVASYQWGMLNPTYYSLPRRIFAGVIFNF